MVSLQCRSSLFSKVLPSLNPPQRFGYTLAVNLGASSPRGTVEFDIPELDTKHKPLTQDTFLALQPHEAVTPKHYTQGIALAAKTYLHNPEVEKALTSLPQAKQTLEHLVLFVPGPVTPQNHVTTISNLKLQNVDLNTVGEHLAHHLKHPKPIPVTAANDMVAPALSYVAKQLKDPTFQQWLKENPHRSHRASIAMTGGGYGVIHANLNPFPFGTTDKTPTHTFEILPSEQGHLRANEHELVLEQSGASVASLIQNYCERLGLKPEDKLTQTLVALGNGKLVTQYPIRTKNPEEIKALEATACFNIAHDTKTQETLATLKNVSLDTHLKAQTFAIDTYVDALSRAVQGHALGGMNHFIVGGPLAGGIRQAVKAAERPFQKHSFETLIEQTLMRYTDTAGFQKMAQQDLKVSYEPFKNVLEGASLLPQAIRTKDNSFILPVHPKTNEATP